MALVTQRFIISEEKWKEDEEEEKEEREEKEGEEKDKEQGRIYDQYQSQTLGRGIDGSSIFEKRVTEKRVTDGWTDGRKKPLIELLCTSKNTDPNNFFMVFTHDMRRCKINERRRRK